MIEHLHSAGMAARDAMSADWDRIVWAWGAGEFSVAWVLTSVVALIALFYAVLSNDRNYEVIRDICHRDSPRRLWRRIVLIGLRRLSRWFGPSWSFKAFDRSLALAFIYPLLVVLVAWALGGPFRLGLDAMDSDSASVPNFLRWIFVVGLPAFLVAQVYWARLVLVATRAVAARFDSLASRLDGSRVASVVVFTSRASLALGSGAAGASVMAFAAIGTGLALGAVVPDFLRAAIVWTVACIAGLALMFGIRFALIVAFVAFVASVASIVGVVFDNTAAGSAVGAAMLPLLVVVPVLNSVFDFMSWLASRRLFMRLARRGPTTGQLLLRTIGHVALDAGLAVVFLVGLAVVLPAGMALYSHAILAVGAEAGFPWRDYLGAAGAEPWGAGLAVTAMLVTTLVPTLLHTAAVGFALVLPTFGHLWPDETVDPSAIHRLGYAVSTTASILASFALLLVLGVAIHAFIAALFGGFGTSLAAIAEASGAWVETWFTHAP